jgi:hypothetical protein
LIRFKRPAESIQFVAVALGGFETLEAARAWAAADALDD